MARAKRKDIGTVALVLVALAGVCLLAYPAVSDWWNQGRQTRAIMSYVDSVDELDSAQVERLLGEAEAYNARLAKTDLQWELTDEQLQEYDGLLDVDGTGVIGYIDIPKIDVTLPVYRGTMESAMQVATTHMAGTSLPVGGKGTHACITGHRGLPSARLFTDLDKLQAGDTWTITVLDRTLTYEVDQIRIVEPAEIGVLYIEPEEDLCTLITCTPYGINSQRLLVRGHRVENLPGEMVVLAEAVRVDPRYMALAMAVPVLLILFVVALVRPAKRKEE